MSVNGEVCKRRTSQLSLIAHSPYEGWKIAISGMNGRLEAAEYHSGLRAQEPTFSFDVYDRKTQRSIIRSRRPRVVTAGQTNGLIRMIRLCRIPTARNMADFMRARFPSSSV